MSCYMSSWVRSTLALVVCVSFSVCAANAQVFDDFSDLNDTANPTWSHLSGLVLSNINPMLTFDSLNRRSSSALMSPGLE